MNKLTAGIIIITLGIILILIYEKASKKNKASVYFEKPYLKNAGIGFILFGLYYLLKFFYN